MKIRCIDKENPPCKRCRHMKLDCRFAPPVVVQRSKNSSEQGEATKQYVAGGVVCCPCLLFSAVADVSDGSTRWKGRCLTWTTNSTRYRPF
jgi:hypothetical protein